MKKLTKLAFLIFIPIIIGILLLVFGADNESLLYVGIMFLQIGVPVTMFACVIIGLVLMITGRLEDKPKKNKNTDNKSSASINEQIPEADKEKPRSASEREAAEIGGINSSRRGESKRRQTEYVGNAVSHIYKNSSTKEKILGWLFFGFLMGDFAMIFVFTVLGNMTGIIVCFSLFCGTIVLSLVIKVILEKLSLHAKADGSKIQSGTVQHCFLSSMGSSGGSSRRSAARVRSVTYRVVVEDEFHRTYNAYADRAYDEGETVVFAPISKRRATIVDSDKITESVKARVEINDRELKNNTIDDKRK